MKSPQRADNYSSYQTEAARRVLVDVQQVLAAYQDSLVVVGGWVPDLLLPDAVEAHVGSIDVDLALDAKRLNDGRYAELIKSLLDTGRFHQSEKPFQLYCNVPLPGGLIRVDVDFLASKEFRMRGKGRVKNFRVQQADGCALAFRDPRIVEISGAMVSGVENKVSVRVASLPDFLVMKCHALAGRDKPKDAYDIVYCLDHAQGQMEAIAAVWRSLGSDPCIENSIKILRDKFEKLNSFGTQNAAQFKDPGTPESLAIEARRAFELVQRFLRVLDTVP